MFRLIVLLIVTTVICHADLLSSLNAMANQGSASLMSTFMQLSSTLGSQRTDTTAVEVNNLAAKLSSAGYLNGYDNSTFDSGYVTLDTLNTTALNSTLKGALSPSLVSTVVKLLNSSGVVSGVTVTSDGYNLGTLTLSNNNTAASAASGATTQNPIAVTNYPLAFVSPLISVNLTDNATFVEKLKSYKDWYIDTITALRQNNPNPNITDYRKAFFCYPGPAVLNESLDTAPSVVTCDWIKKTYQEIMNNATALISAIPNNSTYELSNNTGATNLTSQIDTIASKLSTLIDLISGSTSQDAVESQLNALKTLESKLAGNGTLDDDLLQTT